MPNAFSGQKDDNPIIQGSTTLNVVQLNTSVSNTLTSQDLNKYHLCSGGSVSITLPNPVNQGSFLCFKNQTSSPIGFTNLPGIVILGNQSLVLVYNLFLWVPL
jgi:hypothetical protein